jgi:hypothetical protein
MGENDMDHEMRADDAKPDGDAAPMRDSDDDEDRRPARAPRSRSRSQSRERSRSRSPARDKVRRRANPAIGREETSRVLRTPRADPASAIASRGARSNPVARTPPGILRAFVHATGRRHARGVIRRHQPPNLK